MEVIGTNRKRLRGISRYNISSYMRMVPVPKAKHTERMSRNFRESGNETGGPIVVQVYDKESGRADRPPMKGRTMTDPNKAHEKACLASAMISAIQNLRDTEGIGDVAFRIEIQENTPLVWADSYLASGTATCTCAPSWSEKFNEYMDAVDAYLMDTIGMDSESMDDYDYAAAMDDGESPYAAAHKAMINAGL